MLRGQEARIDLGALAGNLKKIKSLPGRGRGQGKGVGVIAVVKADAYGHGAVRISKRLWKEGVLSLAVAYGSEARTLREEGVKAPILVLFDEDPGPAFDLELTPVLHSLKSARRLSREAQKRGREIGVHVKVDTGMGRMGLFGDDAANEVALIASLPGVRVEGLMSHFSEIGPGNLGFARLQLEKFNSLRNELAGKGIRPFAHISSSAGALLLPEAHLDAVRVGLVLYGSSPFEADKTGLKPVMNIKTRIILLKKLHKGQPVSYDRTFITARESLIAVVPVGYADGYLRAFSNKGYAMVGGKHAPVAGRVCMDLTMLDVTGIKGVSEGDEAVLLGDGITGGELAGLAGTNPYEIMTSLGGRARRYFSV